MNRNSVEYRMQHGWSKAGSAFKKDIWFDRGEFSIVAEITAENGVYAARMREVSERIPSKEKEGLTEKETVDFIVSYLLEAQARNEKNLRIAIKAMKKLLEEKIKEV